MNAVDLTSIFTETVVNQMLDTYDIGFNSNSRNLIPVLGGETQNISTMGDRFFFSFKSLSLSKKDALRYGTHLRGALSQRIVFILPDFGYAKTNTNVQVDDGNGQTLVLKGLPPNYTLSVGQFFTIVQANSVSNTTVNYLHSVITSDVTANSTGWATVTMAPTLREPIIQNSTVLVDNPVIEGLLEGNSFNLSVAWTQTAPLNFKITESR